jgi:putative zinc finger/helix-turn-helix YgiT family protein
MEAKTYTKVHEDTFEIRGHVYKVEALARFDVETNELVYDEELDDQAIEKAQNMYRKEFGYIFPSEIIQYRAKLGITQREFAKVLGWSQTTIALYEKGALPSENNNNLLKSLFKNDDVLLTFYEGTKASLDAKTIVKIDEYIADSGVNSPVRETERAMVLYMNEYGEEFHGGVEFNFEKLSQMVLYFASTISNLTKTKLNKLLFYADFLAYRDLGVSLSGTVYIKDYYGPVPLKFDLLLSILEDEESINLVPNSNSQFEWYTIINSQRFDKSLFSECEISVLRAVGERFKNMSRQQIVDISHEEPAWEETESYKAAISFSYAKKMLAI